MENKIIFVIPNRQSIGGITTWFNLIEKICNKNKIEYHLINKGAFSSEKLKKNFFEKYLIPFIYIKKQKKMLKKYSKDSNILHIATSGGNGFYRDFKLLKKANKLHLNTILHLHYGNIENDFLSKRKKKYFQKCLKYSNHIISIDDHTNKFLSNNNISNVLINNPVELHEYSYNFESKKYIFVGQVKKQKGIFELLDSFKEFNKKREYLLEVIGPIEKSVAKDITKYMDKSVVFTGPLSHEKTLKLISESKCLLLPSYTEGSPNVLLEAMSFGVPCVGTSVGNIPNMIKECGIIIEPKNNQQIIDALNLFLNKQIALTFSKNAYNNVMDFYSLDSVYLELKKVWWEE